jgi:hypothetical protein
MGLKEWEAYFWYLLSTLQTCRSKCALVYAIAVDLKCLYECIGFNLQPINWILCSSRSRLCSHGKFVRDTSCLMSQSSLVVKQGVGWDSRLTIEWHFNRFVTFQQSTVVNFQLALHWGGFSTKYGPWHCGGGRGGTAESGTGTSSSANGFLASCSQWTIGLFAFCSLGERHSRIMLFCILVVFLVGSRKMMVWENQKELCKSKDIAVFVSSRAI